MSKEYKANELLVQKQKEEGLSSKAFAEKLGMSEGAWSLIANHRRSIGWLTLKRIREVYPDIFEFAVMERIDTAGGNPQAVA